MTSKIQILTPENVRLEYDVAGIGSRAIAIVIDSLIQAAAITAVIGSFIFVIWLSGEFSSRASRAVDSLSTPWVVAALFILLYLVQQGYFLIFEAVTKGSTPGKRAVGICVIMDDGRALTFRAAVLRNVLRTADSLPVLYALGLIVAFTNPMSRRIGDWAGGTLVVKTRSKARVDSGSSVDDESRLSLPAQQMASALPAADIQAIRHLMHRLPELPGEVAERFTSEIAGKTAERLDITTEAAQFTPSDFLIEILQVWDRRNAP